MSSTVSIYLDLTQYTQNRLNTGIQRVVNEYLKRAIKEQKDIFIFITTPSNNFKLLDNQEVAHFLEDVPNYQFTTYIDIDIFNTKQQNKIFFDIDSVWNSTYKRADLYPKLKANNFKIYNFIYDLIPILFPQFLHEKTKQTFTPYIKAIYKYSDFVCFDSNSAKDDFFKIQDSFGLSNHIDSKVIHLGSNFTPTNTQEVDTKYKNILNTKYILFVGTIEPRKQQPLVLEVFEQLHKTNPNLHLVYIGKTGWKVEPFIDYLTTHSLKEKNIHHFENISDSTLKDFYQNAFLVTYLSHYEGYGLPIVESLKYANITIVSKNSSMPEVGLDFVDYIHNNSKQQLYKIINDYINNYKLYKNKKDFITQKYQCPKWKQFYKEIKIIIL